MKSILIVILSITVVTTFGQSSTSRKQKVDSLTLAKQQKVVTFLDISLHDNIADIGTGSGYSLIPIANEYPTLSFTVEDIDSNYCNKALLINRIRKSGNKTNIENFSIHIGTEKSTNLPTASFNKILVFDVIHEMTYRSEMLSDLKRILQVNGSVFIEEILVHKTVKKDKVCNYPFLTEDAFKKLLVDNKYQIKREMVTFDTGNNKYIKIFECVPLD